MRIQKNRMIGVLSNCLLIIITIAAVSSVDLVLSQTKPAKPLPANKSLTGDQGWPRFYNTQSGGIISIHQPQVATWDDQKKIVAYAAVSFLKKEAEKPDLGTIRLETDTSVSLENRLVNFSNLQITEANFPSLAKEQLREITDEIAGSIPKTDRVIALDRVLAYVEASAITPKNVEGMKNDPPVIFFSQTPSLLLAFDGQPIWSPIKDTDLKYAVNTNWDLFQLGANEYYLRIDRSWLVTTNISGEWKPAPRLPAAFAKLPADDNWKDARLNLPGVALQRAPHVYVAFNPTELLLLDGPPKYVAVPGSSLQWVSNTDSDVFRLGTGGAIYYLVAGRWFSAPDFRGPWTFASQNLPEDFKKIPLDHPRARVLSSVPGTQQAAEAIVLAQIPQTARVNIKEVKAPDVVYQGDPQFVSIEGTTLSRAANTDKDIIKFGNLYYMCYQGVWFSADLPTGPWQVATSVPPEIYKIPPSSPAYNVTYVTVEPDKEDTDWVTVSAYAGYTGLMIGWGCPVWGTGWYYPPYYWYGGYYPIYYPYWRTYGYGSWYNPYTGVFGTAGRVYGPYGGAGFGARYNPSTGTYARGAFAYGPNGVRGGAQAYNPRTGNYAQTRQGANGYGSWGSTAVKRGDDWAATKRVSNRVTGNTTRVTRTENGGAITRRGSGNSGFVGKQGDNMYAGRDGNVYRRDGSGNWQKYENGNWSGTERPQPTGDRAANRGDRAGNLDLSGLKGSNNRTSGAGTFQPETMQRLNSDAAARSRGSQQVQRANNVQRPNNSGGYNRGSGGGSLGRGGYGGGGFRGGGFRGGGRRR
jgi:hypothetical protein